MLVFDHDICRLIMISHRAGGPAVLYISAEGSGTDTAEIMNKVNADRVGDYSFFGLQIKGWDTYLTPWPRVKGQRNFAGCAPALLEVLQGEVLPKIRTIVGDKTKILIAGYSLAGLFAVWSMYESEIFAGAVSCSGSLWYPGWKEYIVSRRIAGKGNIYLSLGNREKHAKDADMKQVEDNTVFQKELLEQDPNVFAVEFRMNEGGHFADVAGRMAQGIRWMINSLKSPGERPE